MAITLVSNTTKVGSTNGGTSDAINSTGANCVIVVVGHINTISSVTDSNGNAFSLAVSSGHSGGLQKVSIYYCASAIVGAGHTFTVSGTNTFPTIIASAWAQVKTTSPLNQTNSANASGGSYASWQTGSITPEGGDLVIAATIDTAGTTGNLDWSPDPPFGLLGEAAMSPSTGSLAVYEIQTASTARNPTFTPTASPVYYVAVIASFLAAPRTETTTTTSTAAEGMSFTFVSTTADTATASEQMSLALTAAVSDTASVTEGRTLAGSFITQADTAAGAEQTALARPVDVADAATVLESMSMSATMAQADAAEVSETIGEYEIGLGKTYILTEPLPYGT
jgi:hypothetical protein